MYVKVISSDIESIKRFIHQQEVRANTYYDINPEIDITLLNNSDDFLNVRPGINRIRYKVECISRLGKWRKWFTLETNIDVDQTITEYRDYRLEEVLKK